MENLPAALLLKSVIGDFRTYSRQLAIDYTYRDDELIPIAKDLFTKLYKHGTPVRLLGVRLSEFTNHAVQASLFDDAGKKNELYKAIDEVKINLANTL
jgi:DNA polymerase-4